MYALSNLAVLALPAVALAQYGGGGAPPPASTTSSAASAAIAAASSTPSTASSSSGGTVHMVTVGPNNQFVYQPNTLTAAVGDQIQFNFASAQHSVTEGSFSNACQPVNSSAFYSGFVTDTSGPPFTITVNSTDPIWFYCSQITHCQSGMVGVINPPSGMTQADYAAAAAKTSSSGKEPQVQGGVFAAAKVNSGSSSASGSAAASTSVASSTSGASTNFLVSFVAMAIPLVAVAGSLL